MPQSQVPAEIRDEYQPFRVQHGRNQAQQVVQTSASPCMVFRGIVAMSERLMRLVEVGDCLRIVVLFRLDGRQLAHLR